MSNVIVRTGNRHSLGLCSILTIIFAIAKITGYVTWSWWIVFSPIWGSLLLFLSIVIIFPAIILLFSFIFVCIVEWLDRRKWLKKK